MTLAPVITLYDTNASDIPAMLRKSAESIEVETDADDRTRAMVAVQLTHDGNIAVYGWGAVERFTALGLLQAGVVKLADAVGEFSP